MNRTERVEIDAQLRMRGTNVHNQIAKAIRKVPTRI